MVLDIDLKIKYRLINLYRSFNPQDGISQANYFKAQIEIISKAYNKDKSRKFVVTLILIIIPAANTCVFGSRPPGH